MLSKTRQDGLNDDGTRETDCALRSTSGADVGESGHHDVLRAIGRSKALVLNQIVGTTERLQHRAVKNAT
jgi:hypothetical protein